MLIKKLFSQFYEHLIKKSGSSKEPSGFSTRLFKLDRETDGFCAGDYWLIVADAGIGKTSLCFNMALDVCAQGGRVAYFVTEMSKLRCMERITSMRTNIDYYKIRHPHLLAAEDYQRVLETIKQVSDYNFDIHAGETFTAQTIFDYVKKSNPKPHVVFVDYIQQCLDAQGDNFVAAIQKASFTLQAIAKTQGVCTVALSQVSYEGRDEGRAKGSSALRQNADYYIFLKRDHDAKDMARQMLLRVKIDKARYGASGIYFDCVFNLKTGRIKEHDEREK